LGLARFVAPTPCAVDEAILCGSGLRERAVIRTGETPMLRGGWETTTAGMGAGG